MSRINFTKKSLAALAAPKNDRYVIYRDSGTRGLGLKIEPSGHRVYFWSRKAKEKLEWKTIGEFESVTVDDARAKAASYNKALNDWKKDDNPGDDPFARPAALTLGEVIEAYTTRYVEKNAAKPDRSVKEIRWQTARYLSAFRDRKVMTIRRGEILLLRESVHDRHGSYASNRMVQMLRAAINWSIEDAELWKGPNPAAGISLYKETKRERFLLAPELAALWEALNDKKTTVDLRHYVMIALLTGARKNDIMTMRWDDVAFDGRTWRVPTPKSGESYTVALTAEVVDILRERKASAVLESPWVFPSHGVSGHLTDLKKAWTGLLRRAGIENLRQHDLRRTMASWQAAGNASLSIIGKSLGHKSLSATAIYAKLQLDPIRASVEAATRAMLTAAGAPEPPKLLAAAPERQKRARRA